ncbi:MAG: ThuA domain-containing protein [Verrucomicrobiota bacterium]
MKSEPTNQKMMNRSQFLRLAFAASAAPALSTVKADETNRSRKLVLIAGPPSHPPMMHEFRAGTILLEERLQKVAGLEVDRHEEGWVKDEATFSDADAVVCFSDGNGRHPVLAGKGRLATMEGLAGRGVGFGCMHFAVEVPKETAGPQFRKMIGGCYEHEWSCNPIWNARFDRFPEHPISRGIKPFTIKDEWYFNMRFTEGFDAEKPSEVDGVRFTPVLVTAPSDETREGPYVYPKGPYEHIQEAKGRKEAVMWAVERPDGGRGFGFTGGHFHVNWQNDSFRKIILNALCWVAKVDVPVSGIDSAPVGDDEINRNLDDKKKR